MRTNFPNMFPDSIDAPSDGQVRLLVEPESDYNTASCETPRVKVCLQKYATGIGWFNQKSLSLTLDQASFLEKEIGRTAANHKMKSSQSRPAVQSQTRNEPPNAETPNKVIQFPADRSRKQSTDKVSPSQSEATGSTPATILPFRPR